MSSVKIDLIEKKNELVKQGVGNELVEQGAVGRGQWAGGWGQGQVQASPIKKIIIRSKRSKPVFGWRVEAKGAGAVSVFGWRDGKGKERARERWRDRREGERKTIFC